MSQEPPQDYMTTPYLKGAMTAFKKRLKAMRLDEESGLERGPFSKGMDSDIVAIQPPSQYPNEVWEKLVDMGKLRRAGHGLYELNHDSGQG